MKTVKLFENPVVLSKEQVESVRISRAGSISIHTSEDNLPVAVWPANVRMGGSRISVRRQRDTYPYCGHTRLTLHRCHTRAGLSTLTVHKDGMLTYTLVAPTSEVPTKPALIAAVDVAIEALEADEMADNYATVARRFAADWQEGYERHHERERQRMAALRKQEKKDGMND